MKKIIAVLVVMAVAVAVLGGCNKREEKASQAREIFTSLRSETNGVKAENMASRISTLNPGMKKQEWFKLVGAKDESEIGTYVQIAYTKEASAHLAQLTAMPINKPNPAKAMELRSEFLRCQNKSGKSIGSWTSMASLNSKVQRQKLADARQEGPMTNADLQAAGIKIKPRVIVVKTKAPKTTTKHAKRTTTKKKQVRLASR